MSTLRTVQKQIAQKSSLLLDERPAVTNLKGAQASKSAQQAKPKNARATDHGGRPLVADPVLCSKLNDRQPNARV
jgi:hypothetical protein